MYAFLEKYLPRETVDIIFSYSPLEFWEKKPVWFKPYFRRFFPDEYIEDVKEVILDYLNFYSVVCLEVDNKIIYFNGLTITPWLLEKHLSSMKHIVYGKLSIKSIFDHKTILEISVSFQSLIECRTYLQRWFCSSQVPWIN